MEGGRCGGGPAIRRADEGRARRCAGRAVPAGVCTLFAGIWRLVAFGDCMGTIVRREAVRPRRHAAATERTAQPPSLRKLRISGGCAPPSRGHIWRVAPPHGPCLASATRGCVARSRWHLSRARRGWIRARAAWSFGRVSGRADKWGPSLRRGRMFVGRATADRAFLECAAHDTLVVD
eukprot:3602966-Prymnesium_polylepis.1